MKAIPITYVRLGIGLGQGLLFYWLFNARETHVWPATASTVFVPLSLIIAITPVLAVIAVGAVRLRSLLVWCASSVLLLALLGVYDVMRRGGGYADMVWQYPGIVPSLPLWIALLVGFFIAQSLVMAGDFENKSMASYPVYFDVAWKLAVQINFSIFFVAMFWGVLWLGASMFLMLKVHAISDLLKDRWFSMPATTMAFAYAIHLTDVRMNLVRAIRTVKLTMMAWLLPLITFFAAGFLITIPIQGGELLWKTHHASQIILVAMLMIILYLNAAYQDGLPEHMPKGILRYSGHLAAGLLLPLWGLAVYSIVLRVLQYGWTVHLIQVSACLLVTFFYAIGYIVAAFMRGPWLKKLETTNIITSYVILLVLLALFSPLADPARLSVASQMERLKSGAVSLDDFDYHYLSEEGGKYGTAALHKLHDGVQGPDALAIQTRIDRAIMAGERKTVFPAIQPPAGPKELAANIKVYPGGRSLPDSFLSKDWKNSFGKKQWLFPSCLYNNTIRCEAFLLDSGATPKHIILANENLFGNAQLFQLSDLGEWEAVGTLSNLVNCRSVREAMRAGNLKVEIVEAKELQVNGVHIQLKQDEQCPEGIH